MRIVLLDDSFPAPSGNAVFERFIGLLDKGLDIHIVCGRIYRRQSRRFPRVKKNIHVNGPGRPGLLSVFLSPFALIRGLLTNPCGAAAYVFCAWPRWGFDTFRRLYADLTVLALRPDIIHFESVPSAVEKMYLKEVLCCKTVVSIRGRVAGRYGREMSGYHGVIWEKADMLLFFTRDMWEEAGRISGMACRPRRFIPPAIDPGRFRAGSGRERDGVLGSIERPLRILGAGRLIWENGYEYAFSAISALRDKGVHFRFHLAGEGAYKEALMFARHQLRLEDAVEFPGWLPAEQVRSQMRWADVFLHPAVSGGPSAAVLEAQAAGLPVVCSDARGFSEQVVDGKSGLIVRRRDADDIAAKLSLLAKKPDLREKIGRAGVARADERYSLKVQLNDFEALYKGLMK